MVKDTDDSRTDNYVFWTGLGIWNIQGLGKKEEELSKALKTKGSNITVIAEE